MSSTLDIEILGKTYRVACAEDERESLAAAAQALRERIDRLRGKSRSASERLAVMAALELAHEQVLRAQGGDDAPAIPGTLAPAELKRRIDHIEARIGAALEPNDSLF